MRILIGLALILALGAPAAADAVEKRFQLVGFTTAIFDANEGVLGFTTACQVEFTASRMCTSREVMETVAVPVLSPGGNSAAAWVRPSFAPTGLSAVLDESGSWNSNSSRDIACNSWRSNAQNDSGLVVLPSGSFNQLRCDNTQAVACCALTLVPEPPTSSLNSAAAATLASLVAGRALCPG